MARLNLLNAQRECFAQYSAPLSPSPSLFRFHLASYIFCDILPPKKSTLQCSSRSSVQVVQARVHRRRCPQGVRIRVSTLRKNLGQQLRLSILPSCPEADTPLGTDDEHLRGVAAWIQTRLCDLLFERLRIVGFTMANNFVLTRFLFIFRYVPGYRT